MQHIPIHQCSQKMSEVITDLNNERLRVAWKHLSECVEPLHDPELEALYVKSVEYGSLGRKENENDSYWEVPDFIFDYLMKCETTLREVKCNLALQGLAPSYSRLKKMAKKYKEKKHEPNP